MQVAFNDLNASQIRGLKQRVQKFRVRFNKRAFKAPIKVSLVSIEEEGGSVAGTYLDDPGGPDFAHHAVENDCVTPRVGWVIERISIVIILIFRKGNFGVVAGEPIEEGELLFLVKLNAQYGRTARLLAQSSRDVFFCRDR